MLFRISFLGLMLFVFYWGTSSADLAEQARIGTTSSTDPFELPVRYRLAQADAREREHRHAAHGLVKPAERTYR